MTIRFSWGIFLSVKDHGTILLVEDNEDDVFIIRRALTKAKVSHAVQVARDGLEAVAYLNGEGKYADRQEYPLPVLVLLDLQMPKMDGFEVLSWIQGQPLLKSLRVVVLTNALDSRESSAAHQLGAHSFLVKPADFADSAELMLTFVARLHLDAPNPGSHPPTSKDGSPPA